MAGVVRSVAASAEEWEAWKQAASRAGLTVNGWARRALGLVCELEAALSRLEEKENESGEAD